MSLPLISTSRGPESTCGREAPGRSTPSDGEQAPTARRHRPVSAASPSRSPPALAEGEEEVVLDAVSTLAQRGEGLFLVIAPRHPERFDAAEGRAGGFRERMGLGGRRLIALSGRLTEEKGS